MKEKKATLRQPDQNTNIKKNKHPTTKSFTYKLHVEYISLQKCYRGTQSMLEANIVRSDQEHNIQHSLALKASKKGFHPQLTFADSCDIQVELGLAV